MEPDDPQQRIAELERRLAEQKRMAEKREPAEPVWQPAQMLDAGLAVSRDPIRCLLSEYPMGWKRRGLAIDIGQDAVWFTAIDSKTSGLIGSARRDQVNATPAAFTRDGEHIGSTMPALIVRVPGAQPLTIGCEEKIGDQFSKLRFWWRGKVPWVNTPAYTVSAADLVTLVDKFGLAPYLEDRTGALPNWGDREWIASPQAVAAASETRRDHRSVAAWMFVIGFVGLALGAFYVGADNLHLYQLGAPTVHGQARTTSSWLPDFVIGAVFLLISIFIFFGTRSQIGRLVEDEDR
jgi:hypothetical protein